MRNKTFLSTIWGHSCLQTRKRVLTSYRISQHFYLGLPSLQNHEKWTSVTPVAQSMCSVRAAWTDISPLWASTSSSEKCGWCYHLSPSFFPSSLPSFHRYQEYRVKKRHVQKILRCPKSEALKKYNFNNVRWNQLTQCLYHHHGYHKDATLLRGWQTAPGNRSSYTGQCP